MSAVRSPLVSEFRTSEQEASYDSWFRTQVRASLEDGEPTKPHDQVMAEMDALIEQIARENGKS